MSGKWIPCTTAYVMMSVCAWEWYVRICVIVPCRPPRPAVFLDINNTTYEVHFFLCNQGRIVQLHWICVDKHVKSFRTSDTYVRQLMGHHWFRRWLGAWLVPNIHKCTFEFPVSAKWFTRPPNADHKRLINWLDILNGGIDSNEGLISAKHLS